MAEAGKPRHLRVPVSRSTRWMLGIFLSLLLVVGAGNLTSSWLQNRHTEQQFAQAQKEAKAQSQALEQRLCNTLVSLATLKPPAGNGTDNPSRLYEQKLAAKLAELSTDIECEAAR